jgi:hypothetical protein
MDSSLPCTADSLPMPLAACSAMNDAGRVAGMVNVDPVTTERDPGVLRVIAQQREACLGVHGSTVAPVTNGSSRANSSAARDYRRRYFIPG